MMLISSDYEIFELDLALHKIILQEVVEGGYIYRVIKDDTGRLPPRLIISVTRIQGYYL